MLIRKDDNDVCDSKRDRTLFLVMGKPRGA